ncbi:MAG: hypothetical protein Q7U91_10595 [Sideroxyarcus sp.]|nr:hypothetical protein [Sideroxyarcus sp.]
MTELTSSIISALAVLMGVALTLFGQSFIAHRNRLFDLEKERMKLAHESSEKRLWLVRERLERLHLLVGEIGREFSQTFLTIDWEATLKRTEYHEKYRLFSAKLEESQMIADLYMQDVSELLATIDGEMSCYWGNFSQMLYLEEQGKKVDHTSQCYKDAFKYSRSIPSKVTDVQREIRSRSARIMNP